jgi:hypothetical protein
MPRERGKCSGGPTTQLCRAVTVERATNLTRQQTVVAGREQFVAAQQRAVACCIDLQAENIRPADGCTHHHHSTGPASDVWLNGLLAGDTRKLCSKDACRFRLAVVFGLHHQREAAGNKRAQPPYRKPSAQRRPARQGSGDDGEEPNRQTTDDGDADRHSPTTLAPVRIAEGMNYRDVDSRRCNHGRGPDASEARVRTT